MRHQELSDLAPDQRRWAMGDEELGTFQAAHLRFLKSQVNNLQDLRYTRSADYLPDLDRQLFAAREELDNYVGQLREHGKQI